MVLGEVRNPFVVAEEPHLAIQHNKPLFISEIFGGALSERTWFSLMTGGQVG
jgi:hypothetical protein